MGTYEHWPDDRHASGSAHKLAHRFKALGFGVKVLGDAEATQDAVLAHFKNTVRNEVHRGDLVVVSWHGHAFTHVRAGGRRTTGYLVPHEGVKPVDTAKEKVHAALRRRKPPFRD